MLSQRKLTQHIAEIALKPALLLELVTDRLHPFGWVHDGVKPMIRGAVMVSFPCILLGVALVLAAGVAPCTIECIICSPEFTEQADCSLLIHV